jgi:hypothetical protein
MRAESVYDEIIQDRLPRGWRARWEIRTGGILFRRTSLVVEAGVAHPFPELIRGAIPSPLAREEAARLLTPDHDAEVPRVAVILSTSGWRVEDELHAVDGTSLFLVEPVPPDGYKLAAGPGEALPGYLALESREELLARLEAWVEASRVDLVLRGLEVRDAAERTGVPVEVVEEAFRASARRDEFLRLSEEGDTVVLRRA